MEGQLFGIKFTKIIIIKTLILYVYNNFSLKIIPCLNQSYAYSNFIYTCFFDID